MAARILGPVRANTPAGVEFEDAGDHLILTAHTGIEPGERFSRPAVYGSFRPEEFQAPDVSMVGFGYTQFALPVRARPGGRFDFRPAHNLRSPSAVMPLLLSSSDGRVELLAPIDSWHEQIIAVRQSHAIDELQWGWHGDLESIGDRFQTRLGIFTGHTVSEVFDRWGQRLRATGVDARPTLEHHPLLTHLSYWTDNGAAYWYRTEDGVDIATTLADKLSELDRLGLPVASVELDSWFYPHETTRSVSTTGYLEDVPPTGMLSWTPRPDVLPDGMSGLQATIGHRSLVLHSRHISPSSPYLEEGEWWIDRIAAHPTDPAFFQRWFDDAVAWGASCIEQDWMMVTFLANRELRASAGRAMDWQRGLDDAAGRTGVGLLWCMALPGDFAAASTLENLVAVRTCDDYRFADDSATLWVWYLTVNTLAAALGLPVFKDCFFSSSDPGRSEIDGDPHAELEALLSALSAGVVGIGDRIGRTDVEIVSRVCRPDGRLVGPDRPITLCDTSFLDAGLDGTRLCWASTESVRDRGTWTYILAVNTSSERRTISDTHELGADQLVYHWRTGTAEIASELTTRLEPRDWSLFVCCPIEVDERGRRSSLIGDPTRYATMGATRVDDEPDHPRLITTEDEADDGLLWWSEDTGLHRRR